MRLFLREVTYAIISNVEKRVFRLNFFDMFLVVLLKFIIIKIYYIYVFLIRRKSLHQLIHILLVSNLLFELRYPPLQS